MMAALARRLSTMSRDELSWRLRAQVRAHVDEAVCAIRRPQWARQDVGNALAVETLPPELQSAIEEGDWDRVHDGLRTVLRGRPSRFVLNSAAASTVVNEIGKRWPAATADAEGRATTIAGGSFDLLGYRALSFDSAANGGIDWHFDPVHRRRMPIAFWSRVPYLDPECGDHKVVWELNRHQHWLALSRALWLSGDRFWAREMVRQLAEWLRANPPLQGANWASMLELGFRSISWLWALHAILASGERETGEQPWLVDVMVALDRQLQHVERNLSLYFSPNTHLTGEALALYVAGAALPELKGSTRWLDTGRSVLLREIDRQIEPDGGHAERSTHYHRYTLDFYLLAVLTARRIGDLEAEERFGDAVDRLADFARALADGDGRLPLIGDDDAGRLWPITGREVVDIRDSLGVAAAVMDRPEWAPWGVTEEVLWLTANDREAFARALRMDVDQRSRGDRRTLSFRASERRMPAATSHALLAFGARERRRTAERRGRALRERAWDRSTPNEPDERTTRVFADTGFVTSTTRSGDHLVFDVGRHGYLNGGHAHADALSVVLALRGRSLLVDPGTPTYTMDRALRDQLRSSVNHNTVTVDGTSSAVPRGPFHWQSRADARLEVARANAGFALIEARHDAYGAIGHRRVILASELGYVIADQMSGAGHHEAAQHWHFDPRWRVTAEASHTLRLSHDSGMEAWLIAERGDLALISADPSSALGWFSPTYGIRVPSWTARVSHSIALPSVMVSWCGIAATGHVPTMERLACESTGAVAVRIRTEGVESVTALNPGGLPLAPLRIPTADIETDARALQCGFKDGRLTSLSLADGSCATVSRALRVTADACVGDLHVACEDGRLVVMSTTPPAALRLEGMLLGRVDRVVVHGRERTRRPGSSDPVVITAADWPPTTQPFEHSGSSRCAG